MSISNECYEANIICPCGREPIWQYFSNDELTHCKERKRPHVRLIMKVVQFTGDLGFLGKRPLQQRVFVLKLFCTRLYFYKRRCILIF